MQRRTLLVILIVLVLALLGGTAAFVLSRRAAGPLPTVGTGTGRQDGDGTTGVSPDAPREQDGFVVPSDDTFSAQRRQPPTEPVDSDKDGLADSFEATIGTDPGNPDTDGDGTNDADEYVYGTDPLTPGPPPSRSR